MSEGLAAASSSHAESRFLEVPRAAERFEDNMELMAAYREVERLTIGLKVKDEEIAGLKNLLDDRDRQLKRLHEEMINDKSDAGIIEGLQKTFGESDKRHADSVRSLPKNIERLRKTIHGLQKTFEDRMNSLELAARENRGYVSIVATTVINVAKGIVGRLTDRKRPSAADVSPPAKRLQLGACNNGPSPMNDYEDYDDIFYDAVDTNDKSAHSTAPSTAHSAKRQHLDTAPVSSSPAPQADNNTTFNLGDDDEIPEASTSNNNNDLDDDNQIGSSVVATVEDIDKIHAYDADGTLKRWDQLSADVQDEVRTFLSTRADEYSKLGNRRKNCLNQSRTVLHRTSGTAVACKSCAFSHLLCIANINKTFVMRPLCELDRNACGNPNIDSIDFFRLPLDTKAPSKNVAAGQYDNIKSRK
jgi:hypothetical protein